MTWSRVAEFEAYLHDDARSLDRKREESTTEVHVSRGSYGQAPTVFVRQCFYDKLDLISMPEPPYFMRHPLTKRMNANTFWSNNKYFKDNPFGKRKKF